ncbi:hypothetical protein LZ554_002802 [Drepanopeziza brunnea f. sp. 'monogermtubi']|nr:hypothetical protein LZ554_002802 [Drepanopeziza brunnea f. sp. 'monogermtubi']
MFLPSYSNAVIILLMLSGAGASSQIQEKIADLPACSNNCMIRAATSSGCAPDDFGCQCQKQDGLIGTTGGMTSQNACLMEDCGAANTTNAQDVFRQICNLLKDPTSSSSTAPNPTNEPRSLRPAQTFTVIILSSPATAVAPEPTPLLNTMDVSPPQTTVNPTLSTSTTERGPTPYLNSTISPVTTLMPTPSSPPTASVVTPLAFGSVLSSILANSTTTMQTPNAQVSASPTLRAAGVTPSAPSPSTASETNFPLSASSESMNSYQTEANQSTLIAQLQSNARRLPAPAIAAIVVGTFTIVVLAVVSFVLWRRRKMAWTPRVLSSASSRKSGEDIMIFLDIEREKDERAKSSESQRPSGRRDVEMGSILIAQPRMSPPVPARLNEERSGLGYP